MLGQIRFGNLTLQIKIAWNEKNLPATPKKNENVHYTK